MKRINIVYGGVDYSIGNASPADIKDEIERAIASGKPHWMTVNQGEGQLRLAELLITPGIDIAIIPVPDPTEESAQN